MRFPPLLCALLAASAAAQKPLASDLVTFTRAAKQRIEHTLVDPGSVQYRGVYVSRHASGDLYLCGELNAKNSMGGYAGFRSFISSTGSMVYVGDQIHALLEEYCGNRITPSR